MTGAQTEARAIFAGLVIQFGSREGYDTAVNRLATALAAKDAELAKVRQQHEDAERFAAIERMCGAVENGSDETVQIHQDDATRGWIISVGKNWWHGGTMRSAIDEAAKQFPASPDAGRAE